MPEYLSPGVYVEEVELGPRPIEGVSTSTAGLVGVAERGPLDVPVLITSEGDYRRVYGGTLRPLDFHDSWYLPLAVRGFFQNLGQRAYVVRVAPEGAAKAQVELMGQGSPSGFATSMLTQLQVGDDRLIVSDDAGLVAPQTLRIDDGALTEYVDFGSALGALNTLGNALMSPAYVTADFSPVTPFVDATLETIAATGGGGAYSAKLAADVSAGSDRITVDTALPTGAGALHVGDLLLIGAGGDATREIVPIAELPTDPADLTIRLAVRLARPHLATAAVVRSTATPTATTYALRRRCNQGDGLVVVDGGPAAKDTVISLTYGGGPAKTYHVVGALQVANLRQSPQQEHATGGDVHVLTMAAGASKAFSAAAAQGATVLSLATVAGVVAGAWVQLTASGPGSVVELALVAAVDGTAKQITLAQATRFAHDASAAAVVQTATSTLMTLAEVLRPGDSTAVLGFTGTAPVLAGAVLQIGEPATEGFEYVEIGAEIAAQVVELAAGPPASLVANGHRPGARLLARSGLLTVEALDVGGYGNEVRVKVEEEAIGAVETKVAATTPAGADVPLGSITGIEPGSLVEILELSTTVVSYALARATSISVVSRTGFLVGDWIRVGRADAEYLQIASLPAAPNNVIGLSRPLARDHAVGEWVDRMETGGLPRLAKVADRVGTGSVRFDGGGLPVPVTNGWTVRSRDFKLTVEWVKRGAGNPRNPGFEQVVESETFRHLTLDDRHSQYIGTVVGLTTGPARLWDRRTEGQSNLVRVTAPVDAMQPAPDVIEEVLQGGRRRAVGRWLTGGDDDIAALGDATYKGNDNVDPLQRTGLQSLRSVEDVSLVAIPGRVSPDLQQEIITHCESMHYRFGVLDATPGKVSTGAGLADVQAQRQQFDTKYAALYYPWPRVPDPFSPVVSSPADISVPPSGHLLGVYARTDVTRGVHKAPANEVINGITGFQRSITKGEQDILNPYPSNINVLRDFRDHSRGLRSWGGRVITSDPEWKYVNVRRLFIFVERSLELGLQWVVFEPNNEDLWARVTRTVSNFLTTVWRSGALMGTTAEQAFFVRCDRSTMTDDDIDNGRLILVIGIAPTMPAEFVVIRIGQWQGGSAVEEA